jgi:tetratricopeptide (TPR) repeat protein
MPEKSLHQVPRNWRELFEKGNAAFEKKNFDYAIKIFEQVLKNEPAFYQARTRLRDSQFAKHGQASSGFFKRMLGTATNSPQLAKAQFSVRNNPAEALSACEEVLNNDPNNVTAHKILAEAALSMDFPKTAVLSLEIAFRNAPRDHDLAQQLAQALIVNGQIERAEKVYSELQKANPGDPSIAQELKNLAARRTLREGGYDEVSSGTASYRDILKNKEEAVALEQENRQVKSDDVATRLIAEKEARLEKEPGNRRALREIAELYIQKKEFDKALEFYQRIQTSEGPVDPSIEKEIAKTMVRKIEHQISALDQTAPDYPETVARLEKEKQDFLINDAKRRVEKYPNDLQYRFELGVLYFNASRLSEAIQEFQKAQNNPNKKVQSLYYLGQSFARRNMNDLALRTLQNALREKEVFDHEKKEILYAVGTVLDNIDKTEEAIEYFKQIYEVDIGFKDVAQKVDAYYASAEQ